MPLTDLVVRSAKPKDRPYKLSDQRGLYLLVSATGRYWRFDYRFLGKRKTLALGAYPDTTLAMAREKHQEARTRLASNIDPGALKQLNKRVEIEQTANSFESVAMEWLSTMLPSWKPSHSEKILGRLRNDVFPHVGKRPISQITAPELLVVLKRIESRGAVDSAHRTRNTCSQIFRFAITVGGRADRDPAADLRGGLQRYPKGKNHFAGIVEPREVGRLLQAIDGFRGSFVVKCALRLAPLVFVRPGELRHAEWSEIDLDRQEWRLPAEKMKRGEKHVVPLSRQVSAVLEELRCVTGSGRYVFPSLRGGSRPMSENSVNFALRSLGYSGKEMTGHGFRSTASTLLHEAGWPSDVIERQLSHGERNPVKAAYCHAEYLPERRRMMQTWADWLDRLRSSDETGDIGHPSP